MTDLRHSNPPKDLTSRSGLRDLERLSHAMTPDERAKQKALSGKEQDDRRERARYLRDWPAIDAAAKEVARKRREGKEPPSIFDEAALERRRKARKALGL